MDREDDRHEPGSFGTHVVADGLGDLDHRLGDRPRRPDDRPTPGPEDAGHLPQRLRLAGEELIPLGADHHVGRVGLQWKLLGPALKPPDPGADPTRHLEHGADRVDADHLPGEPVAPATRRAAIPVPHATSTTVSPGRTSAVSTTRLAAGSPMVGTKYFW